MKYIRTTDWFLVYDTIKGIYKNIETNKAEVDKKGKEIKPSKTTYKLVIDHDPAIDGYLGHTTATCDSKEELDKLYEEVVNQVIANEQEESKKSSAVKATKGTTNTRMKLNE